MLAILLRSRADFNSGYTESCRQIVSSARYFSDQVKQRFSSDIRVLGDPRVSVVAIASADEGLNIHAVGDAMGKKGWHLSALSQPAGLHMAFTVSVVTLFSFERSLSAKRRWRDDEVEEG